jgi:hypothetical protein
MNDMAVPGTDMAVPGTDRAVTKHGYCSIK